MGRFYDDVCAETLAQPLEKDEWESKYNKDPMISVVMPQDEGFTDTN